MVGTSGSGQVSEVEYVFVIDKGESVVLKRSEDAVEDDVVVRNREDLKSMMSVAEMDAMRLRLIGNVPIMETSTNEVEAADRLWAALAYCAEDESSIRIAREQPIQLPPTFGTRRRHPKRRTGGYLITCDANDPKDAEKIKRLFPQAQRVLELLLVDGRKNLYREEAADVVLRRADYITSTHSGHSGDYLVVRYMRDFEDLGLVKRVARSVVDELRGLSDDHRK